MGDAFLLNICMYALRMQYIHMYNIYIKHAHMNKINLSRSACSFKLLLEMDHCLYVMPLKV